MADIQKCPGYLKVEGVNQECQVKEKCYRFMVESNDRYQAWGNPSIDFNPKTGCSSIYPMRSK